MSLCETFPAANSTARPESWPEVNILSKAEGEQFLAELSRCCEQDALATAETDNLSYTSSVLDFWDAPTRDDKSIWNKKAVLSCGGGGVRALSQLYILKNLMMKIAHFEQLLAEKNKPTSSADSPLLRFHSEEGDEHQPRSRVQTVEGIYLPCHYFDYIGGTSVGGRIIAVMLGRLRFSVDQVIRNFEHIWIAMGASLSRADKVLPFRKAKGSNSRGLDLALEQILTAREELFQLQVSTLDFGIGREAASDEFASDPELCKTIVIAMPDQSEGGLQRPYFFRTYNHKKEGPSALIPFSSVYGQKETKVLIRDVCKATSAAPGFFKGVSIGGVKFRDGAIWTTNPALEIYSEVEEIHSNIKEPIELFINLGCGRRKPRRFQSPTRRPSKRHIDEEGIDRRLEQRLCYRYCPFEGPSDLFDLEINEWRIDGSGKETFPRIRASTEAYCKRPEVLEKINLCAEKLVRMRQSRAKTTRWEKYALGIRYTCQIKPECSSYSEKFEDRDAFMDHLMWEHHEPPQDEANWNRIQRLLARSQITTVK